MDKSNATQLIAKKYRPFIKYYIHFCEGLQRNQYANNVSLQKFAHLYNGWKKRRLLFFKFLFLKKQYRHENYAPLVETKENEEVDNPAAMSQVLKDVGKRLLKLKINPLKVAYLAKNMGDMYKKSAPKHSGKPKTGGYNIGGKLKKPTIYKKYDLTEIQPGDIIYENEGFFALTGHIAIVDGVFYDVDTQAFYLRGLEAIHPFGICKSVWDDERITHRDVTILRYEKITEDQVINVIDYIRKRSGQKYLLRLSSGLDDGKWYCSDIVGTAYHKTNLNILSDDISFSNIKDFKEGVDFAY